MNESRSIKVEKYMLYKEKHDLLYRKDTESVHLQRTIDWKKPQKEMFLNFSDFKPNVLKFLKNEAFLCS